MLLTHLPTSHFRISAQRQSFQRNQNSASKHKTQPKRSTSSLYCILPTANCPSPYLHVRMLYLATSLPEGQAAAFRAVNVSPRKNKRSATLYIPAYYHHHHSTTTSFVFKRLTLGDRLTTKCYIAQRSLLHTSVRSS
jgi:hypothetical protein